MKITSFIFIFIYILILPLYADDFTLDEWLNLYEEGFFGEVEELPPEIPLFKMDVLGLRFVIEEESVLKYEESLIAEKDNEDENNEVVNEVKEEKEIIRFALPIKEDESVKPELFGLQLTIKEEPEKEEVVIAEDETSGEEESILAEEDFFDDDLFLFEGPSFIFEVPPFEPRSFKDIFPNLTRRQRSSALSRNGLRYFLAKDSHPTLIPNPDYGIDSIESVLSRRPSHIIEAVLVVPYREKEFDLLDIYNALGRIGNIKDYYIPYTNGNYYIFTESTRIVSNRNRRAIPDPEPADNLPFSETIYIRLKESTLGNLFIRGDISISAYGITYNMTNFTDIRYLILPVMGAERFSTILYLEPVKEGVLIYSLIGFYLPDFVADRVNLSPSINRRIQIFIDWITDGLRQQELAEQENVSIGQ